MKIDLITEPELEFGAGPHVDIRFGLKNYGPVTSEVTTAPKEIQIGFIGTQKSIQGVKDWMDDAKKGLPAKESNKPNFFPAFPGFGKDTCFQCEWITSDRMERAISPRDIARLIASCPDRADAAKQAVEVFMTECRYLTQITKADVIICAPPVELLAHVEAKASNEHEEETDTTEGQTVEGGNPAKINVDFHDLLKAKSLSLSSPIQYIRPSTYDESVKEVSGTGRHRGKQDQATKAWNFYTALYYKAGGTPWRLRRNPSDYDSCFIGVSFYHSLDRKTVHSSVAQVFNERGEGMILRGGDAEISKDDRLAHLKEEDMKALLVKALNEFSSEHHHLPARVVLHKTSAFNDAERKGCEAAFDELRIKKRDMIVIRESMLRLFRNGQFPPQRGTFVELDARRFLLYTRGSTPFYQMYPGMYVPRALEIDAVDADTPSRQLAEELIALTKMNWNNTQFDSALPITLRAAKQVGSILKYAADMPEITANYAFYM